MAEQPVQAGRSRMMASVRTEGTAPEMVVRSLLRKTGFWFRKGGAYGRAGRVLPGHPDIILPKYQALIFVHGCFWHCHECELFAWPKTRRHFWREKLSQNRVRDETVARQLTAKGWRVGVIWECTIRGPRRFTQESLKRALVDWLEGGDNHFELSGSSNDSCSDGVR